MLIKVIILVSFVHSRRFIKREAIIRPNTCDNLNSTPSITTVTAREFALMRDLHSQPIICPLLRASVH